MKILGVIANCAKEKAPAVLARLRVKAQAIGLQLLPDAATAKLMGVSSFATPREVGQQADTLMVLGGDGSMLRAVRDLAGRDIPVIGVNLGALGFMTSVPEDELERALDCLVQNQYTTSLRLMLDSSLWRKGVSLGGYRALNDVLLTCGARVGTLRMTVDGQDVGDFVCDGLIVSTPTGSTGHSLSAGGPVLLPTAQAVVVSLICPHTLSTRPLVMPSDAAIEIKVVECAESAMLAVDGQVGQPLEIGDVVRVNRSPHRVRFIHLPGYDYFALLRQKLHWRGTNV
ncbi:MAG: NAD(+)/NADH kinase [bacterium]